MSNVQDIKDMAMMAAEFANFKKELADNEIRLASLEQYKAKTERYGFFLLGMVALGTMLMSGFEKIITKITAVLP